MNGNSTISQTWNNISMEMLDLGVRSPFIRRLALKRGINKLHNFFVVENQDLFPPKIQEMRYMALRNLLLTVDKALADGRIAHSVRRGIVKDFIGQVITGEMERQKPFREVHGINPPSFLTISPTKKCNLACKGCYAASSQKMDNTLDYDVFQRILDEKRHEWGSHFTVISGGEPLMYESHGKDMFDIFKANSDNYFMMYTNATLITRDVARKMAEAGNVTPAISVEGWEKETDYRRGKGVFAKIQDAMEHLRAEGVPFGISITAMRNNADTIMSEEFLDHYFDQQGAIYGWIFQYMPIGRAFTIDMMVTPEQRQELLKKQMVYIYDKERFLIDFWNGGPMTGGCIAAGRPGGYFYVDWDGNIAPCVFFPYHIANVYDLYANNDTLTSVLFSKYFQTIRTWQDGYTGRDEKKRQCNGKKVQNLFMPCPIRDHYQFAYNTVTKNNASPMDRDAGRALKDPEYRLKLIDYDAKLRDLLNPMWNDGFSQPVKSA